MQSGPSPWDLRKMESQSEREIQAVDLRFSLVFQWMLHSCRTVRCTAEANVENSGHDGDNSGRGTRRSPWGQQWPGNTHILLMYSSGSLISYAWESAVLAVGQARLGICRNRSAAPQRMFGLNLPMPLPGTDSKWLLKSLPISAGSSLGRSTKEETVLL